MTIRMHTLLALTGLLAAPALSRADDLPPVTNPLYTQECGSCHVPYPPGLLSRQSWNGVMNGLGQHFGADASLDDPTAQRLRQYLEKNAGSRPTDKNGTPQLRITETRWFLHEHQEELPASIWQNPAVKSAANCGACHTSAADGIFTEDNVRLPKGVNRK